MKNYFDYDKEEVDYDKLPLGELGAIIDSMEDEVFSDKRKAAYKEHIKLLNQLFLIYNRKAGWKVYKLI